MRIEDKEQKAKKLRKLANMENPVAVFRELEALEATDLQLAEGIKELDTNTTQSLTALAEGLQALDEKKVDKDKFDKLDLTVENIKLTPGPKGDKGDDYILTSDDKKEIAEQITVPVVEKIIERTEVVKEQPIITQEVREVAVADTPDQIRDKLLTLEGEERLDAKAIKNLPEITQQIGARVGWGAHPLQIQDEGVVIEKVARFINFTGAGVTASRSNSGVVTVNITSTIDGSGAANRLAFWSDVDTLTSDAGLTFDSTNDILTLTHATLPALALVSGAGDDYQVRNASGTFAIRNTTDNRNDITIGNTGTITLAGGVTVNTTGELTLAGSDGLMPYLLVGTGTGIGGIAGLVQIWASSVDVVDIASTLVTYNQPINMSNKIISNIGNAGTDFTSAGGLTLAGAFTANGTITANSTSDFNGAVQFDSTITVGINGTGHDVLFYGDTAGKNLLWDADGSTLTINTVEVAVYPYSFNIVSGSGASYMGIFNDGGTGSGAFFGLEDRGGAAGAGDLFAQYNYQGGDIGWNVSTGNAGTGTVSGMNLSASGHLTLSTYADNTAVLPNGWNNSAGSKLIQVKAGGVGLDAGINILGSNTARGMSIWYDSSTTISYIDNKYDNTAGVITTRLRTNGTPVVVSTAKDTLMAFNTGNVDMDFDVGGDTDTMLHLDAGGGASYFETQVADTTTAFQFRDLAGNADVTYDSSNGEWETASGVNYVMGGKITTYNNVATEGYGVGAVVDLVALTGQVANIATTNFTNAGTAGLYRINYVLEDTTADVTAGTLTLTIAWTDGAGATTHTNTLALTALGRVSGVFFAQLASGNVTYNVTITGAYGTAVYALHAIAERIN